MENGIQLKNPGAQKILEKFSQHYGILKIFQERVETNQNFELAGRPVFWQLNPDEVLHLDENKKKINKQKLNYFEPYKDNGTFWIAC